MFCKSFQFMADTRFNLCARIEATQQRDFMKASQKLKVVFENYTTYISFQHLDIKLMHLANKLERTGDMFGPVNFFDGDMCIQMSYADKRREPIEPLKIFGYDADALLAMQYK